MALYHAWAQIHLGGALYQLGTAPGLDEIEAGLREVRQTGAGRLEHFDLSLAAEAYARAGRPDGARESVAEAFDDLARSRDFAFAADLHRMRAALALRYGVGEREAAEADLRRALDIARQQEARSLELRAARDLASMLAERGERQQAYDLLAPVYDWFTEGFATPRHPGPQGSQGVDRRAARLVGAPCQARERIKSAAVAALEPTASSGSRSFLDPERDKQQLRVRCCAPPDRGSPEHVLPTPANSRIIRASAPRPLSHRFLAPSGTCTVGSTKGQAHDVVHSCEEWTVGACQVPRASEEGVMTDRTSRAQVREPLSEHRVGSVLPRQPEGTSPWPNKR
jgi:hypothetical protein